MLLHRYELYCDDEEQKVGFIVGLNNLYNIPDYACGGISIDEYLESLVEPFNDELPFPPIEIANSCVCGFTDFGQRVFEDAIRHIITAYEDTIFEVREIIIEIDDNEIDKLEYADEYQACISITQYQQLKHEAVHRKIGWMDTILVA